MPESGSDSARLEPDEQEQASRFEPLRAKVIHEILRKEGESELQRTLGALFWSGLAAGLSMGFSFAAQGLLHAGLPDAPWRGLITAVGYTLGFVIIVLGRQQLFTESTLTAVLPVLTRRDLKTGASVLRLWGMVLATNIVGTWIFAAALAYGHPLRPEVTPSLVQLATEAVEGTFWPTVLKAMFAGWLIALMVWLLPSARSASLFIIMLLTYVVALGRFPHIIAGSTEAAYAVLSGHKPFADYWTVFFFPTLIGNTIGGVSLVAILNHAPVAPELKGGRDGYYRRRDCGVKTLLSLISVPAQSGNNGHVAVWRSGFASAHKLKSAQVLRRSPPCPPSSPVVTSPCSWAGSAPSGR